MVWQCSTRVSLQAVALCCASCSLLLDAKPKGPGEGDAGEDAIADDAGDAARDEAMDDPGEFSPDEVVLELTDADVGADVSPDASDDDVVEVCEPDWTGRGCGNNGCGGRCPPGCEDSQVCLSDGTCCTAGWHDWATGLLWQTEGAGATMSWGEAVSYCQGFEKCGLPEWSLPTIGQLRSIIRGCDATMTGGTCDVDDTCVEWGCWHSSECEECAEGAGPEGGCYTVPSLDAPCDNAYWSSSSYDDKAWKVVFSSGDLNGDFKSMNYYAVRCVSAWP